jgi:hypothetical protein
VYERTGGHAYGSPYPGPIGAIITPLLRGVGQPQAGGAARVDPAAAAAAQRVDPHPGRAGAAARVIPRLVGQNQGDGP